MLAFELQQCQGHADVVIQIAPGSQGWAHLLENFGYHRLHGGLARAARNRDYGASERISVQRPKMAERRQSVVDNQLRHTDSGAFLFHHDRTGPRLHSSLHKRIAIKIFTTKGDKQSTGLKGSRIRSEE